MPIKKYLMWVGGVLLCLMFALDAYLPKTAPHRDYDFDRTALKITAPDSGIAPDTGAVAITAEATVNEPADPPKETQVTAQSAARQAFGKLEAATPKKPQRKRSVRLQPAKPVKSATAAQNPWFSQGSADWSSNWNSNWTSSWNWRGSINDEPRQNGRRQTSKQLRTNQHPGDWNFNLAGAGRNTSCWGC